MLNPGQHVICIEDRFHPGIAGLYTSLPIKGRSYVIRDIRLGINPDCKTGAVSVLLVGLSNPLADSRAKLERGFDESRFRPVEEQDSTQATVETEKEQLTPYEVVV